MKILIVMDSSGRGLDQFTWQNYPNVDITTVIKPGYTMERLACETRQLAWHKGQVYDIICFAGGINNLTSKINQQNGFELFYMHCNTKVSSLKDCFSSLLHEFSSSFCVKFATIAPASLVKSREYAATLSHTKIPRPRKTVSIRKWRTIDIPAFTSDVGDRLALVPISADSSQLLSSLSTIFTDVLDAHAPESFKDIVIRPQQLWYTDELRAGKKSRRKSEQKWRDHKQHRDKSSDPNWAEYQCAKQSYNLALDQAKSLYYNDKIVEAGSDSREVFSIVKSLLHEDGESPLPSHVSVHELAYRFAVFSRRKLRRSDVIFL